MTNAKQNLEAWGPEKKLNWFLKQSQKRSYAEDVQARVNALRQADNPTHSVEEYGCLSVNPDRYPLYVIRVGDGSTAKPNILITGGVHGYETSGVKGALLFLENHIFDYSEFFNFVVAPCISPWSYETVNRLDPIMENPNREFKKDGKAEESRLLMDYLLRLNIEFDAHIDLHETTNSDRVFLPEEYAKNGLVLDAKDVHIPDGFYLIGIKDNERKDLETAMMDSVAKITHIAKADSKVCILGTPISFEGVIHGSILGLCAEWTNAKSRLGAYTTEMYPDSPRFNGFSIEKVEQICSEAQVACLQGALNFWKRGL